MAKLDGTANKRREPHKAVSAVHDSMSMTRLYMSSIAYAALEKWSGKWRLSVSKNIRTNLVISFLPNKNCLLPDFPGRSRAEAEAGALGKAIVRRVLGKADSAYAIAQTHITQCNGNATARQPKREEETEEK
uniref:Uncharacterized protein n=1 Tax=Oryza sativa subsp. japonica TaxID=39947 RepID=Q10AM2_ORYSJ|nr:hypothetical protein LOC_Os03g63050 [Oryza sativa Japonica Group]